MGPQLETRWVRFAGFEADLRSGELYRDGKKIRLQEQPFQVLAALLRRPGELVTRDELRREVWPADTYLEFDHALNTAIKKIRAALADDALCPRFVETIPKRGYRLIVPVTAGREPALPAPTSNSRPWRARCASFVAGGLAALLLASFSGGAPATRTVGPVLSVLPVQNESEEPESARLSHGITQELITQLGRDGGSSHLVLSSGLVAEIEPHRGEASALQSSAGADYLLAAVVRTGRDRLRVTAELIRARDGTHIWGNSFDHDRVDELATEENLARAISAEVREAVASTRDQQSPRNWYAGAAARPARGTARAVQ